MKAADADDTVDMLRAPLRDATALFPLLVKQTLTEKSDRDDLVRMPGMISSDFY